MSARSLKAKGFTLVEILIVVVILGILAAIVIPQFTSASEAAKASSLVTQLQSLRSQLELYQLQHNGNYPAQATFWEQLTGETTDAGTVTAGAPFGPYLQKAIKNPFLPAEFGDVVAANTAATGIPDTGAPANTGWWYNASTGEIKAVLPSATKAAEVNLENDTDKPGEGNIAYQGS
jgi:general secretion pathway protein G